MQYRTSLIFCALALLLVACPESSPADRADAGSLDDAGPRPDDAGPPDAGMGDGGPTDASDPADAEMARCTFSGIQFREAVIGVTPGVRRDVRLALVRDYCVPLDATIEVVSGSANVTVSPSSFQYAPGDLGDLWVAITGVSEGSARIRAHGIDGRGMPFEALLDVVIASPVLPGCTGDASGTVMAGGELEVTTGALAGSRVAVPPGAARDDRYHVDPFAATIECAPDQLPPGYIALGPAVSFESAEALRFDREIDFAIPIRTALLPSRANHGYIEIAYTGPSIGAARIVPIASPRFEGNPDGGTLHFLAPRLGTYQAVARAAGPSVRTRTAHYRAMMGFSMGGSGSSRIGLSHPEIFDRVAPLGGPTDWTYMLEYIRTYHLGGFCTEAERMMGEDCSAASQARAPARGELYEHVQHFEHWWYEDGYDGQGGTFNRSDYLEIFRDLSAGYGNANTVAGLAADYPNVAPPGTPDSDRFVPASTRCANPIIIQGTGRGGTRPWYDDEYNPTGAYDVISFCDGAERSGDVGSWDPNGTQFLPTEVAYAVDVNGNGVRDAGEPVIRNGREPFDDFGADRTPSQLETGYDPLTNPDPAGDDYDFQYNPTGTERNWEWDTGEEFDDVGLDGVAMTPQLDADGWEDGTGGWDYGEGDGVFTRARGAQLMIDTSPRGLLRTFDDDQVDQISVFADGGVRDLFNWVVMGHHTMGGFAARGRRVQFYNGHRALFTRGTVPFGFDYWNVRWEEVSRYSMIRYGSIDAPENERVSGDGGHVGTALQLLERVQGALGWINSGWPGGDRRYVNDRFCNRECTGNRHLMDVTFTYPPDHVPGVNPGHTGVMTIVLPPGYFLPESAGTEYPVIVFGHGYGMSPEDLGSLGPIMWQYMNDTRFAAWARIQKVIFVFADGTCRDHECINGTFYTDAPAGTPNGAQAQSFVLAFLEHMRSGLGLRIRSSETIEVIE